MVLRLVRLCWFSAGWRLARHIPGFWRFLIFREERLVVEVGERSLAGDVRFLVYLFTQRCIFYLSLFILLNVKRLYAVNIARLEPFICVIVGIFNTGVCNIRHHEGRLISRSRPRHKRYLQETWVLRLLRFSSKPQSRIFGCYTIATVAIQKCLRGNLIILVGLNDNDNRVSFLLNSTTRGTRKLNDLPRRVLKIDDGKLGTRTLLGTVFLGAFRWWYPFRLHRW